MRKYIMMSVLGMSLFVVMAFAQDVTTKLTKPDRIEEINIQSAIDDSKLTDDEIDKIKDIEGVKAYLKLLTAQMTIKQKVKTKMINK